MKKVLLAAVLVFCGGDAEAQVKCFWAVNSPVEQGGTLVFRVSPYCMPPATSSPTIFIFEKHYKPNAEGRVFVGVGLNTKPGKYTATFYENGLWQCCDKEEIEVTAVSSQKTRTSAYTGKPAQRTDRQKRAIDRAFADAEKSDGSVDLTGGLDYVDPLCFTLNINDPFGFIYRNNPYRKHKGVDLKAPVGMSVLAVNAGRVVMLARNYRGSREGNMVILSHGLGIFSVYMHLSKFEVKLGETVKQGQLIALSGRTGAGVSEPHLHFGIKIHDVYVDPLKFIRTTNSR